MPRRVRFRKEDIGGDILPILTTGLYRDVLDTLREYVQNSIDAQSEHIELVIDPDTISVTDDGVGMNFEEAQKAIRLGISDKNPLENVGFRGIGIYSAFNLCDSLNIYTRSATDTSCYLIHIDFKSIREALLKEQERRKQGQSPFLYLEKLLEDAVYVDAQGTLPSQGTRAVMSGLLGEVYQRLNDWDQVVSYLQDVVPLPFRPDFKYASDIEKRFRQEDYRIVPLTLQIATRRESIYRPYYNEMFTHGGQHPPAFFDIPDGKQRFGFAWVCINDARQVLKDQKVRGLLIKKFGFSISGRNYLEPYFARTVFNRRITGEVIVQHQELLPNAARSDFEHNAARQAFLQALPRLIQNISEWANKIQEEDKAREVLAAVHDRVAQINESLPAIRRDRERLLKLNVELHDLARQLRPHSKTLRQIEAQQYGQTDHLLKECQKFVGSALVVQKRSRRGLEDQIARSIQREALQPTEEEKRRLAEVPKTFTVLIESYDLPGSRELKDLIRFLDETVLQARFTQEEYREILATLREFMEERL